MTLLDRTAGRVAAESEPAPAPRRWPSAALSIAVPTALVGVHATAYGRWIVDDAAITFAYARSVATGEGPVLQPGADPVEGYSNPLWLALLVLARWVGLFDRGAWFGVPDYVAFPKLLALLGCAGVFACCYAVARSTTARPALVTMIAGTAAVPSFVVWTMSGMENALLALAAAGIAALLAGAAAPDPARRLTGVRVAAGCGVLAAVAALTRPDGLVYAAAFPLAALLLVERGRVGRTLAAVAVSTVAFAVPAGAYLWWRLATFGEYLPNTALAKSQGLPGLASLARPAELVTHVGAPAAVVVVLLVGAALAVPSPGRAAFVALLVPLGLAVAAFAVLEPDWMGLYRFATPVWALGPLAAVIAAARLWPILSTRARAAGAAATVAATAISMIGFADVAREFRAAPTAPLCLVAQNAGRNIAGYAELIGRRDATVLVPDIGGAALAGPVRVLDLAGLADARIAAYRHDKDWAGLRDFVFDDARPTFIKGHPPWTTGIGLPTDERLATDYAQIGSVSGTTDWVRLDALPDAGALQRLRDHFVAVAGPADQAARLAPRGSCGDRLRPGSNQ